MIAKIIVICITINILYANLIEDKYLFVYLFIINLSMQILRHPFFKRIPSFKSIEITYIRILNPLFIIISIINISKKI